MGNIVKINTKWLNDMSFESEVNGHKIILDASSEVGGNDKGPRPKPLMLVALAGCTGMDVVSILKKMRVEFDELRIEVQGEMAEEHPKFYTKMKIIYYVKGKNIKKENVEKAVKLSKEKYCGVSALYSKAIPLEYEIKINE